MSIQEQLEQAVSAAVEKAWNLEGVQIQIEQPRRRDQGDYSTNTAMKLASSLKLPPRKIAEGILENLELENLDHAEIAGPGFINFYLKKDGFGKTVERILESGSSYGTGEPNGTRINLEYVSANPTGSLHLGHARGAAWGDSLSRILKKAGYDVTREYYVNDAGNQIHNLALSLQARYLQAKGIEAEIGADGYLGEDIRIKGEELAAEYPDIDPNDLDFFRKQGIAFELDKIERDLARYRVSFDVWSSEQAIRDAGKIENVLQILEDKGLVYEQDGALWFASSHFGDDKDRVLRKKDGSFTYLVPDIAYHHDKYSRGFDQLVNLFGADHHGYIDRLKASMTALGHDADRLNIDIIQMVRLVENGEEVKMSKRMGNATTINELIDWVGTDAARYFFTERALNSHLDFNLSLAKSRTNENPVYYAQYAHARMSSILEGAKDIEEADQFDLLTDPRETDLLKTLEDYPEVIQSAAASRQVNRISQYIQKLAGNFHVFYNACRVIDSANPELTAQRIGLVKATRTVLADALNLLGIEAPEKM